jgi:sec-independent protein translocase protein TatA
LRAGWAEILAVFIVAMLLFVPTKLPDLMKGLGEGIRNFKKSVKDEQPTNEEKK